MPTWKEIEKKYGKTITNKMKKSQWVKGITAKIVRVLCACRCEKCGHVYNHWIGPPFDWKTTLDCDCGQKDGLHIETIIKSELNIPESDIDRAYRDVTGQPISEEDWD